MKGVVEEIREKDTGGGKCFVLTIDDQKMSFFEDSPVELGDIEKGDKVEYETEKRGKYTNITALGLLKKGVDSPNKSGGNSAEMAVLNATKSLAEIYPEDRFDLEDFTEKRDKLARSTVEAIEELKEAER
jgi:hypothetical protein